MIRIRLLKIAGVAIATLHAITEMKIEGATVRVTLTSYDDDQRMLPLLAREVIVPFTALLNADASGDPNRAATLWLVSDAGPLKGGAIVEPSAVDEARAGLLADVARQRAAAIANADRLATQIAAATPEQLPTIVVSETPNSTAGATDV
jgi:hypothetical protein